LPRTSKFKSPFAGEITWTRVRFEPFQRHDGVVSSIAVWETACVICGVTIRKTLRPASSSSTARRPVCPEHPLSSDDLRRPLEEVRAEKLSAFSDFI
jgi:hypothetical protein